MPINTWHPDHEHWYVRNRRRRRFASSSSKTDESRTSRSSWNGRSRDRLPYRSGRSLRGTRAPTSSWPRCRRAGRPSGPWRSAIRALCAASPTGAWYRGDDDRTLDRKSQHDQISLLTHKTPPRPPPNTLAEQNMDVVLNRCWGCDSHSTANRGMDDHYDDVPVPHPNETLNTCSPPHPQNVCPPSRSRETCHLVNTPTLGTESARD